MWDRNRFRRKIFRLFLLLIIISLTTVSCSSFLSNSETENKTKSSEYFEFNSGKFYSKVNCLSDTNVSYVLFMPDSSLNKDVSPLIIFFFDPAKNGFVPVKKYQAIANKYNFILVGSNNSANRRNNNYEVKTTMEDALLRTNLTNNYMVCSGFSGGARVAFTEALQNKDVDAVIACSAGLPGNVKLDESKFTIYSLVGDKDFNYNELQLLKPYLDDAGLRNNLSVFEGEHHWPPVDNMKEAFEFLNLDKIRKGFNKYDEYFVNLVFNRIKHEKDSIYKLGNTYQLWLVNQKIINFFDGLVNVDSYKNENQKLEQKAEYKSELKKFRDYIVFEADEQQKYNAAMRSKTSEWWNSEIEKLKHNSASADEIIAKTNLRLINYLSLMSYLYADNSLKQKNIQLFEFYLDIYEKVDDDNPEVYFMKAKLSSYKNNKAGIKENLKHAIELNFKDDKRLLNSMEFADYQKEEWFKNIYNDCQKNWNNYYENPF